MDEMDGLLGLSLRLLRGLIAERYDRGQSLAVAGFQPPVAVANPRM